MSRKNRVLIALLSVGVAAMSYLSAPPKSAQALLQCSDLKACTGEAGCFNGGDPIGCTIYCTGGGKTICDDKPNEQ